MTQTRKIEIFSAGCTVCDNAIQMVRDIACPSCDISILDMTDTAIAKRADQIGINSLPAILIDGELAECCSGRGAEEALLRKAGIGQPLS